MKRLSNFQMALLDLIGCACGIYGVSAGFLVWLNLPCAALDLIFAGVYARRAWKERAA